MRRSAGLAVLVLAPLTLAGALLAAVALPVGSLFAARPEPPFRIVAGVPPKKSPEGAPAGSPVANTNLKGLAVTVEYADSARRAEFLAARGPDTTDPFATRPGQPERALTFIVAFANESSVGAVFQPGNVALITDKGERAFPLDLTDLYINAERAGVEDLQHVIDRTTAVLYDGSTQIRSGTRTARLLAFRPIEGKWKHFQVHFSYVQLGTETHTISFNFHKAYLPQD